MERRAPGLSLGALHCSRIQAWHWPYTKKCLFPLITLSSCGPGEVSSCCQFLCVQLLQRGAIWVPACSLVTEGDSSESTPTTCPWAGGWLRDSTAPPQPTPGPCLWDQTPYHLLFSCSMSLMALSVGAGGWQEHRIWSLSCASSWGCFAA